MVRAQPKSVLHTRVAAQRVGNPGGSKLRLVNHDLGRPSQRKSPTAAARPERQALVGKMSFNPNDVNYQAYLATRGQLDGSSASEFDQAFVEYLCAQATATGTINTAMVNNAIAQARATALRKSPTF